MEICFQVFLDKTTFHLCMNFVTQITRGREIGQNSRQGLSLRGFGEDLVKIL